MYGKYISDSVLNYYSDTIFWSQKITDDTISENY